jgi:glycosyltransferase involved in cell wall biosynthesis
MRIVLTRREALDTPDGINIFLFTLAEAMLDRNHEVIIVSSAASDYGKLRAYYPLRRWPEVVPLSTHHSVHYGRSLTSWLTKGRRAIQGLRADMVIVNGAVPVRLDALTCTVSHDAEKRMESFPFLRNSFKRYCYGKSDLIVATCDEVRTALSLDLKVAESGIAVIPTCVKLSSYINKPLNRRDNAILHIGTVDYKNPIGSLTAFAAMRNREAKLYITGKPTSTLQSAVAALPEPVRKRVVLLGFVSSEELIELQGTVRIVSVPSNYAAAVASPTVIEAFASGTPVVASPSISRQVLADGVNGYMRDPADGKAVASACDALLSDEHLWQSMSMNATRSAGQFSADRVAGLYLDLSTARRNAAA